MSRKMKLNLCNDERGATTIMVAACMFVIIGLSSLVIDLGQLYTVRNELQNTADAAALAGVAQLVQNQGGSTVRDSATATQAILAVAQKQSQLNGLPTVADGARNDLTITYGFWDIYATDRNLAWTAIGSTCPSTSNANAAQVTIKRDSGLVFGPVANTFAKVMGFSISQVEATAIAYLGYAKGAQAGTVTVPLALPQSVLAGLKSDSDNWLARLLAPREAHAVSNSYTFKDLGGSTFYQNNLQKPLYDTGKAYLVVVNKDDSVPTTVINNLKKYYTSSGTSIRPMARGTRLYPLSEYQWASNIKSIFSAFKSAYNAKKDANSKWRVNVPIYSTSNPSARRQTTFTWHLARNLLPGVSPAQACFTFWNQTYPGGNVPIYVTGFANVDITAVSSVTTCDTCSSYNPALDGKRYSSALDCMINNQLSCRNVDSVSVSVPIDQDTVSPPGSASGGPDNHHMNANAPTVGALAGIPVLVK